MTRTESLPGRIALMAAHCAGMVDLVALPIWVGTLISRYSLDPQQAGLLATLFLAGAVLASAGLALRFGRLPGRAVATAGFAGSALAFWLISRTSDFATMAALHALAGVAAGAALSVTHGTIARSANPHRQFAIVGMALGVFAIVFLGATPPAIAAGGGPVLFVVFAGVMAVAAVICALAFPVPDHGPSETGRAVHAQPLPRAVWFGIVGIAAMGLVQSMMFSFLERVGSDRGFGLAAVTAVLIALGIVNLFPAVLAALLERRWPARRVMLAGPVLQALLVVVMTGTTAFAPYAAAATVFAAVMIFTHTFAFGLLARLDTSGRALAATPAMLMIGAAIGPILGGTLVKALGYGSLGVAAAVIAALAGVQLLAHSCSGHRPATCKGSRMTQNANDTSAVHARTGHAGFPPIHRVVTGHAPDGRAIVASDGPLPTVVELQAIPGTVFHEVWSTQGTPAPVDNGPDPTTGPLMLPPPAAGTRMRFVDIPPDTAEFLAHGAGRMKDAFTQIGDEQASTVQASSPHPLMHRTQSVDYGIVIEGEMTLVLDDSEVLLRPAASSCSGAPTTPGPTARAGPAACCSSWSTATTSLRSPPRCRPVPKEITDEVRHPERRLAGRPARARLVATAGRPSPCPASHPTSSMRCNAGRRARRPAAGTGGAGRRHGAGRLRLRPPRLRRAAAAQPAMAGRLGLPEPRPADGTRLRLAADPHFDTIPVMYQGASDDFLGPHDDVPLPTEADGIDFEGEFGVVCGPVPMAATPAQALAAVRLVVQVNDWSLRSLGPHEMKTGFGFLQAKPSTAFAPVAVTPDELGTAWRDGRVCMNLHIQWNSERFGEPNGSEMNFGFGELVAHAARTRRLTAGCIVGSGTVSNVARSAGSACVAERRVIEKIDLGEIRTGYMRFGDRVRMQAKFEDGRDGPFGFIDQRVVGPDGAGR